MLKQFEQAYHLPDVLYRSCGKAEGFVLCHTGATTLWDDKLEECGPPGRQMEGCQTAARTGQAAAWAVATCLRTQSEELAWEDRGK